MWWYLLVVSVVAVAVTGYDKWAAKHRPKHRTPERALWWLAILGGSGAMWLTMLLIRHKTKHLSFMVGLPVVILAQIALIFAIFQAVF